MDIMPHIITSASTVYRVVQGVSSGRNDAGWPLSQQDHIVHFVKRLAFERSPTHRNHADAD